MKSNRPSTSVVSKAAFWLGLLLICGSAKSRATAELLPLDLRCEYARNPVGVDVTAPGLSWKLESPAPGDAQTAWQVVAASSPESLGGERGDLWDSGKVVSAEQFQVPYGGKPLESLQTVIWKVRVWDKHGSPSPWSKPGRFVAGMLSQADWKAKWIQAATTNQTLLLRREFTVQPGLKRAVAVVCGLGHYELTLNGNNASADLLTPGWTKYDRTCLYDTHEVTTLLREGPNAIGLELGNGMYNVPGGRYVKFKGSFGPLKAIAQLRIEYQDGSVETLISDEHWRVTAGPITFSCVYGGEDHDARLEPRGWNQPGFDDSAWAAAQVASGPGGVLRGFSAAAPAFRKFETLVPVSSKFISNGVTVYDLGQNASLMPAIKVHGPAGSSVRIIPAELLKSDGTVDRGSVGGRESWWQYTLRGEQREEWFPKFFYHGSRYWQVEMRPAPSGGELPVLESIQGIVVHSDVESAGSFECSNDLFNRIRMLVRWAQRSNLASVLTDCPHRERLGWLEQYHLNGPSLRYEFDLNRMFAKGMNDMEDCQLPDGCVPSIAPEYTIFGNGPDDLSNAFRNSPEWGSAIVIVPWQQYEFTGDLAFLRRHYDAMKRYVAYLAGTAKDDIVAFGLGDWYDLGPKLPGLAQLTPKELTATAFYYYTTHILAETARLLGHSQDEIHFRSEAERIRSSFNRSFLQDDGKSYSTGSQCANSIPLVMNLAPAQQRDAVLEAIVRDVRNRTNAVTAGDVGYRYLLRALADGGRSDVIFDMNNQSEQPGYGYQLKQGATSLTEAWNARRGASQNHFMLGQIMEWFYRDVAGIGFDPAAPGFRNVLIRPQPVGDLTWVRASYDSVRGTVKSSWNRQGDRFNLEITIPPNVTATVFLPGGNPRLVGASQAATRLVQRSSTGGLFQVPSGNYRFSSAIAE